MIKILNLYAGIGGNRKLWTDVEVTAVENNPEIAKIYQDFFPDDFVIVADAHQYLLDYYKEYDFIWSSPPCQTHSRINKNFGNVRYIDIKLYEEIIFLNSWHDGKYCVENVIPYYEPLVSAQQIDRHLYWCNFRIQESIVRNPPKEINLKSQIDKNHNSRGRYDGDIYNMKLAMGIFDISKYSISSGRKDQILRNCVKPEIGLHILNQALERIDKTKVDQIKLNL